MVTDPRPVEVPETAQHTTAALFSETRWRLLDPALWLPTLEKYASAVKIAVALVNDQGRLIDKVINPRAVWTVLNQHKPVELSGCPFWLTPWERPV